VPLIALSSINLKKKGYNTDWLGFRDSLQPLLKPHHTKAIILGNGGSAKAVAYALRYLQIPFQVVSRHPADGGDHLC
jgi:shikimate dehydrogenase